MFGIAAAGQFPEQVPLAEVRTRGWSNSVVSRNLAELFHAAVPGLDRAVEINGPERRR